MPDDDGRRQRHPHHCIHANENHPNNEDDDDFVRCKLKLKLLIQLFRINMAMAPDREAFLRKLEGDNPVTTPAPRAPQQQQQQQQQQQPNDDTLRFLEEAGLDSMSIDPASLAALQSLVTPTCGKQSEEDDQKKPAAVRDIVLDYQTTLKEAPVLEVRTDRQLRYATSGITIPDMQTQPASAPGTADAIGSDNAFMSSSSEKLILQQLQLQTQMIMDMQRRIDHLTNVVHHNNMVRGGAPPPQMQFLGPPTMMPPMMPPMTAPHQQQQFVPPQHAARAAPHAPQAPLARTFFASICDYVANIPVRVRETRTAEVFRVFFLLHQRHIRLDGGLVLKVFMAVAIFSAKMMSRRNRRGDFWSPTIKFYLVVGLILIGFLVQSGYMSLFYGFFVKENLVRRIYAGETIDVDQVNLMGNNANPAARAANANANNLRNLIPRNNFVGGNIPAPARNGFNILTDIVILFGSFVLSILPMWKPEAQQQRQEQHQPPAAAALAGDPQQQRPNPVAPPPDMNIHAATDSDEEDEDDQAHPHQD
jgi:hypothetical protein